MFLRLAIFGMHLWWLGLCAFCGARVSKGKKFANIRPGYVPKVKTPQPYSPTCPPEHTEAKALMKWVELNTSAHPELSWLFAVPNGGHRNKIAGAKAKAEGVRRGVPDYLWPVCAAGYVGLAIELKRTEGSYANAEQKSWLAHLAREGWAAHVCKGADEAMKCIRDYLKLLRRKNPLALREDEE
jgi:hypothetical protein